MAIDALHERSLGSAQSRAVIVETFRRIRCLIQLAQEASDPELEVLMREPCVGPNQCRESDRA